MFIEAWRRFLECSLIRWQHRSSCFLCQQSRGDRWVSADEVQWNEHSSSSAHWTSQSAQLQRTDATDAGCWDRFNHQILTYLHTYVHLCIYKVGLSEDMGMVYRSQQTHVVGSMLYYVALVGTTLLQCMHGILTHDNIVCVHICVYSMYVCCMFVV